MEAAETVAALRAEVRGLAARAEGAPQGEAVDLESTRARCAELIAQLRASVTALEAEASAPTKQASEAELAQATAERDSLRAEVEARTDFLNRSQLELQAFALDINKLLLNADVSPTT